MFYVGSNVMNWPLEAQRGLADGHEICVRESLSNLWHGAPAKYILFIDTWSHRYMTAFQSQDAFAELWYTVS